MRSIGMRSATSTAVGLFAFVEFVSGFLQAYYTPMFTDIARHLDIHDADLNWLEGAQLALAALTVPVLARLGDMFGYRRILLLSMVVTVAAAFTLSVTTAFPVFLAAWALMGVSAVWLPLEIALIWSRSRAASGRRTSPARAAGLLIAALEGGAIVGALSGGALVDRLPLPAVLLVPALLVAIGTLVVLLGTADSPSPEPGSFDGIGFALLSIGLLSAVGGMSMLRGGGAPAGLWPWAACTVVLLVAFVLWERRVADPLIDVRAFGSRALAPLFLTAGLFGLSVLGAQTPLSTFARTDPAVHGHGLGATGFQVSLMIGAYVIAMAVGALLYALAVRFVRPRFAIAAAAALIGVGFILFLLRHEAIGEVIGNMAVIGLGAGALMAALPAAAAVAAPAGTTGAATGLTNSVKTFGGVVAACIFGIVLLGGDADALEGATAPLQSYLTVWTISASAAMLASVLLLILYREPAEGTARKSRPSASGGELGRSGGSDAGAPPHGEIPSRHGAVGTGSGE